MPSSRRQEPVTAPCRPSASGTLSAVAQNPLNNLNIGRFRMSLVFRRVSRAPDLAGSTLKAAAIAVVSMTACAGAQAQNNGEQNSAPVPALADELSNGSGLGQCAGLPTHAALKSALTAA